MNLEFTEEQEAFRRELLDWLDENVPEAWTAGEIQKVPPDFAADEQFYRDWQRTLYEGGWAGVHWPPEYGGRGATLWEQVIYDQVMAGADVPEKINTIGAWFVAPTLLELGTEAQKDRFLENILTAEEVWCQGFSEPNAGSDLANLSLAAEERGDEFVLNGQKIWTSKAHVADWCFLLARTDDTGRKHEGITAFMVDMDQPGVTPEPIEQINARSEFNQVFFDDAVARREHIIGEQDRGWDVTMTLLSFEHATSESSHLESRWSDIVEYCRTHERDGRPLSEHPEIRRRLAELDTRIQAAKLTHLRNVSKRIKTGTPGPEGSMDKVFSNELYHELESFAVDLLGPDAALWGEGDAEDEWTYNWLTSYGRRIRGGTKDVQRNIVAERVLGLPKDPKG